MNVEDIQQTMSNLRVSIPAKPFPSSQSFPSSGETRFAKDVTQKTCFLLRTQIPAEYYPIYIYIYPFKILLRNDQRVYSSYDVFRETVSIMIV